MYEKYLNKQVKIVMLTPGCSLVDSKEGVVTAFNDKFIELDNNTLINCFSVLEVIIK